MNCHLGGLYIADFADKNDIGCLAKHGSNDRCKSEADAGTNFDLVDSRQHVLDGILGRDDFSVGSVEFTERGIERGGFATSCWSGDQENPVGPSDDVLEPAVVVFGESEVADADFDAVPIENSHHDRLAPVCWQDADPEVEFFLAGTGLDPPVLGSSFFGDVHFGHDLDSRDNRGQKSPGWAVTFDQHTVNAVADADAVFEGFDMDIAGPHRDRFGDDQVNQPDDRGAVLVTFGGGLGLGHLCLGEIDLGFCEFLQHRVDRLGFTLSVVSVDGRLDGFFG